MAAVLLDTTVLIDLLRGRPGARGRLTALRQARDWPCACAINVEEIARGLHGGEQAVSRNLLDGLRIVPLGAEEGWRAGNWRREAAREGRTLTQGDCLIAAAALGVGGRLATGNPRHFPMVELSVEHWPAGE